MGQISRMARAERFATAFTDRAATYLGLKPGDVLHVKSVGMGHSEGGGEEVRAYVSLTLNDKNLELSDDTVLFDPEFTETDEETIEMLSQCFGISEEEVKERLKTANLLDD
jgi:hypothetical protein